LPHFNFCSGKRRTILAEDHAFKSERLAWLRTPKNGATERQFGLFAGAKKDQIPSIP
jgi:hypothetical protein